jgi:hypothetical protein
MRISLPGTTATDYAKKLAVRFACSSNGREIRNIVLMRPIHAMIEFQQIIGRATRLFDGKDYFRIYDLLPSHCVRVGVGSQPPRSSAPGAQADHRPRITSDEFNRRGTPMNPAGPSAASRGVDRFAGYRPRREIVRRADRLAHHVSPRLVGSFRRRPPNNS